MCPGDTALTLHLPRPHPPPQVAKKPTLDGGVCPMPDCEFVVARWKLNPDHIKITMRDGSVKPFGECPNLHCSMACRAVLKCHKDTGAREFMLTVVEAAEVREGRRLPKVTRPRFVIVSFFFLSRGGVFNATFIVGSPPPHRVVPTAGHLRVRGL